MNDRRNFLKSAGVTMAAIWTWPVVQAGEIVQQNDFKIKMIKVAEYSEYTACMWRQCRMYVVSNKDECLWTPPIVASNNRKLDANSFNITLVVEKMYIDRSIEAKGMCFVDKDGFSPFGLKKFHFPIVLLTTDILNLTYTLKLGPVA